MTTVRPTARMLVVGFALAFLGLAGGVSPFAAGILLASCSGQDAPSGLDEPLRVTNGVFKSGELPGTPPLDVAGQPVTPSVTSFEVASNLVRQGQVGKSLLGRSSPDAVAVALRFADLGTGYWVLPVDVPDPQNNFEMTWEATADFGIDLPPGLHPIRVVSIDANGNAGTQRELSLCTLSPVPDNLNACDPTIAPPAAVLSLAWDTPVDLDLVVVTPDGRVVDAKHPKTTDPDAGGTDAGATSVGVFDRDSNGACVIDGQQRENLVFDTLPPEGSFFVYANLFDACGESVVHFTFSLFEPEATEDPKVQHLVESITKRGVLLDVNANGGSGLGTFVAEVAF